MAWGETMGGALEQQAQMVGQGVVPEPRGDEGAGGLPRLPPPPPPPPNPPPLRSPPPLPVPARD